MINAEDVFGWNPFKSKESNVDSKKNELAMPEWAALNHEIMQLTDLYQQQLAELVCAHDLLVSDQQSLAGLMAPFKNPENGKFIEAPDESVILLKKGLDLRLAEYDEDCRRLQITERRLQRLIEGATLNYESSMIEAKGYAEKRLIEQIQEQRKLIECQQLELDELRFQRDIFADETKRLRQICRYGTLDAPYQLPQKVREREADFETPRSLHQRYASSKPPFDWMRQIRYPKEKKRGDSSKPKLKDEVPVAQTPAENKFQKVPRLRQSDSMETAQINRSTSPELTKQSKSFVKSQYREPPTKRSTGNENGYSTDHSEQHYPEKALTRRISVTAAPEDDDIEKAGPRRSASFVDAASPSPTLLPTQTTGGGLSIGSRRGSSRATSVSSAERPGRVSSSRRVASPRPTTISLRIEEIIDARGCVKILLDDWRVELAVMVHTVRDCMHATHAVHGGPTMAIGTTLGGEKMEERDSDAKKDLDVVKEVVNGAALEGSLEHETDKEENRTEKNENQPDSSPVKDVEDIEMSSSRDAAVADIAAGNSEDTVMTPTGPAPDPYRSIYAALMQRALKAGKLSVEDKREDSSQRISTKALLEELKVKVAALSTHLFPGSKSGLMAGTLAPEILESYKLANDLVNLPIQFFPIEWRSGPLETPMLSGPDMAKPFSTLTPSQAARYAQCVASLRTFAACRDTSKDLFPVGPGSVPLLAYPREMSQPTAILPSEASLLTDSLDSAVTPIPFLQNTDLLYAPIQDARLKQPFNCRLHPISSIESIPALFANDEPVGGRLISSSTIEQKLAEIGSGPIP